MRKKIIISAACLLMVSLTLFARHYTRWLQTGATYPPYTGIVNALVDGRAVPDSVEQIGLIEYNTRRSKLQTIEDAQKVAAEHGGTAFFLPHAKGPVRTGIPAVGTFIVTRPKSMK